MDKTNRKCSECGASLPYHPYNHNCGDRATLEAENVTFREQLSQAQAQAQYKQDRLVEVAESLGLPNTAWDDLPKEAAAKIVQTRRRALEEAAQIVKNQTYFNGPIMGVRDEEREKIAACILHQIDKTICPTCGTYKYGDCGKTLSDNLTQMQKDINESWESKKITCRQFAYSLGATNACEQFGIPLTDESLDSWIERRSAKK